MREALTRACAQPGVEEFLKKFETADTLVGKGEIGLARHPYARIRRRRSCAIRNMLLPDFAIPLCSDAVSPASWRGRFMRLSEIRRRATLILASNCGAVPKRRGTRAYPEQRDRESAIRPPVPAPLDDHALRRRPI